MSNAAQPALFDRRLVWALSAVPLLPLLFYNLVHGAPLDDPDVVHLTGAFELTLAPEAPPLTVQARQTAEHGHSITLPGAIDLEGTGLGHDSVDLWLVKSFQATEALAAEDAVLFLPNLRAGLASVFINGRPVGRQGLAETGWLQAQSTPSHHFVGEGELVAGENILGLRLRYHPAGLTGFVDDRMLIGPITVVQPFVDKDRATRAALEHGGVIGLLLMVVLLLLLHHLDPDPRHRDVYRSCGLLLAALCVYLSAKTGVPWAWLGRDLVTRTMLPVSIFCIVLGTGEFVSAFTLEGKSPRLRRLNRWVCFTFLVLIPVLGGVTAYRVFSSYIIVIVGVVVFLTGRDVWRGAHEMAPLVFTAVSILVLTGVNDLLTDLGLITTPRLFSFGGINLAVCATAVSFNEFIRISRDNAVLTTTLSVRNRELADALVQANESARLKGEFLANTSHELRTPLNTIINVPQGLVELYEPADGAACGACGERFVLDDGEQVDVHAPCPACGTVDRLTAALVYPRTPPASDTVRYLNAVVASGQHLLEVVNDLLDVSKLEAGQVNLRLEPVELGALFDDLRQTMTLLAEGRHVRLEVLPPDGPVELVADRVRLMQVLINLVGNAVKFSHDGGVVEVRCSLRPAGSAPASVCIEVEDHGIGIADADQAVVFEGFRQVEVGTTRRFGGTGLGLTISQQLVELHGGAISLRSALGEGSTFMVELPLSARPPAPQPDEA